VSYVPLFIHAIDVYNATTGSHWH